MVFILGDYVPLKPENSITKEKRAIVYWEQLAVLAN